MTTYAIIETGGKQYRVSPGDVLDVDRLADSALGDTVGIDKVVLLSQDDQVAVGAPYLQGAKVVAKVVGEPKGEKIKVFKYKPKVRYRRMRGHRQLYTRIEIERIER
jgi:large subunit ribosomal protein L21